MPAHVTVLARQAVEILDAGPGRRILDGTLGYGGHSERLLEAGAEVIGVDRDPRALEAARNRLRPFGERFRAVQGNFRNAEEILAELGIDRVDGVLVDLGVSSPQLDVAERGFSFRAAGPLDMRMGEDAERLDEFLARVDDRELRRVIATYGEERWAGPIAKAIKRELPTIHDTARLAEVVGGAIPRGAWPKGIHPATRTFQGLRIAVNDELGALEDWLESLPRILAKGGRAAAISFHSLEDRMVKHAFAGLAHPCRCPPGMPVCICGSAEWRLPVRKAIVADETEVSENPRARSAKLRAVERL
ncbi:16S rRNA (cytosine(1402)-N(4))-methyltransferase RsmH [Vulgatibacter incomptus]|uniref:Ribosomal RNA small subunit methyltransferase H n=1 Tax=Vulgatibacter incomptus TaxID=1391653 RepID=A0A0K1PEN1_9BACT|nr:16S rRNA (cytosine(1402)-N(4))-methyltransferase RsmH [Vulgatibacter incomptus]AKU91871.1 rRNA small subunit methyltransferase H [Vulgatibacter incomptus]